MRRKVTGRTSAWCTFYMLVGNLFTQFASDPSQVSRTVNFLNALLSAGCILFLFWSITRLVRSLLKEEKENLSVTDVIIILGYGLVGLWHILLVILSGSAQ